MNIIRTNLNPETMKATDRYAMTISHDISPLSEHSGEIVTITDYVVFERSNHSDNSTSVVMSIRTADGDVIGTSSPAFIDGMIDILDCFPELPITVEIAPRTARNGKNRYNIPIMRETAK